LASIWRGVGLAAPVLEAAEVVDVAAGCGTGARVVTGAMGPGAAGGAGVGGGGVGGGGGGGATGIGAVTATFGPATDGLGPCVACASNVTDQLPAGNVEVPAYVPPVEVPEARPSTTDRPATSATTLVAANPFSDA